MKNLIKTLVILLMTASFVSCRSKKNIETSITSKVDTFYVLDSVKISLSPDTVTLVDTIQCPVKINKSGTFKTKATKNKPSTEISYKITDNKLEIQSIRNAHETWVNYYKQHIKESIKEQITKTNQANKLNKWTNLLLIFCVLVFLLLLLAIFVRK